MQKTQPICIELLNSFTETELDQFTIAIILIRIKVW